MHIARGRLARDYDGARALSPLHNSVIHQTAQCLAHRKAAGTKLVAQIALGRQAFFQRILAGSDTMTQPIHDLPVARLFSRHCLTFLRRGASTGAPHFVRTYCLTIAVMCTDMCGSSRGSPCTEGKV